MQYINITQCITQVHRAVHQTNTSRSASPEYITQVNHAVHRSATHCMIQVHYAGALHKYVTQLHHAVHDTVMHLQKFLLRVKIIEQVELNLSDEINT